MFNNAGTFRITAGNVASNASFNNTGTVDAEGGQLTIDVGTSTGTFEAGNGGTLVLRGQENAQYAGNYVANAGGTLLFEGYDLGPGTQSSGDGTAEARNLKIETNLNFNNVTVEGPLVITGTQAVSGLLTMAHNALVESLHGQPAATLNANGGIQFEANGNLLLQNVILNNTKIATWSGTGDIGTENAVWDNGPGSTFLAESDGSFIAKNSPTFTGPSFKNEGLFRAVGGPTTDATTFSAALENSGTLALQGGDLSITGTYTQDAGGNTELNNHTLTATGGVNIAGGSLSGQGKIVADVTNAGLILPGGDFTGILTIQGNYTQKAAGMLDITIGGPQVDLQYDQLQVKASRRSRVR